MKKTIGQRMLSLLLVCCMVLSMVYISTPPTEVEALGFVGSFVAGQLLSRGMEACALALSYAAEYSDSEAFQAAVPIINHWVFGQPVDNTSVKFEQLSAQMEAMTEEILTELDNVEKNINDNLSNIQGILGDLTGDINYEKYLEAWTTDVAGPIEDYRFTIVLSAYKEYLAYATSYKSGEPVAHVAGVTKVADKEDVEAAWETLVTQFVSMSGEVYDPSKSGYDSAEAFYKHVLFETNAIDTKMEELINTLKKKLVSEDGTRYIDRAAQAAYHCFPYSGDQAAFVDAAIQKQSYEIYMTVLAYQEFLGMRAMYLNQLPQVPEELKTLQTNNMTRLYQLINGGKHAGGATDGLVHYLDQWLDSKIYFTGSINGSFIYLDNYMREKDEGMVTLTNSKFVSSLDADFYIAESHANRADGNIALLDTPQGYLDNIIFKNLKASMTSSADITAKNMTFLKKGVVVNNGGKQASVVPVYLWVDSSSDKSDSLMSKMNAHVGVDGMVYFDVPAADYYNLAQGSYSDGINTITAITDGDYLYRILNNNYLTISGGKIYNYFANELTLTAENKYLLTGNSTTGIYNEVYQGTAYPLINIAQVNNSKVEQMNYSHYDDSGKKLDASNFVCMLTNSAATAYSKLQTAVTGEGGAKVSISGDKDKYNDKTGQAEAGSKVTITVAPEPCVRVSGIKVQYHNDASNPTKVTSEEILVDAVSADTLYYGEDGSTEMEFSVPYSNVTIVIETAKSHNFNEDGTCDGCDECEPAALEGDCYKIYNLGQLIWFGRKITETPSVKGELMNDLTVSSDNWIPLGQGAEFIGSFDGNGHTITMDLDFGDASYNEPVGLFSNSTSGARISDLVLKGSIVCNSDERVGALIGSAYNTIIEKVISYVNVTNTAAEIDGSNSHPGTGGLTGIFGGGSNAIMRNCAVYADVTASYACVGGLIGRGWPGNQWYTVENCAYVGNVTGNNGIPAASIVGYHDTETHTTYFTNLYYSETDGLSAFDKMDGTAGTNYVITDVEVKTVEQFNAGEVTWLLNRGITDGTQLWYQNIDNGKPADAYPTLTDNGKNTVYKVDRPDKTYTNNDDPWADLLDIDEEGRYIIADFEDLRYMAEMVNTGKDKYVTASYVIVNDIVCNTALWQGIGTDTVQFKGRLDGQGYTISELNRYTPDDSNADGYAEGTVHGLFLTIGEGAVVEDIIISHAYIYDSNGAGAIARENYGTISRCIVMDDSVVNILGDEGTLGGLVGTNHEGAQIENCAVIRSSIQRRKGDTATMGGLCQVNDGTVTNCYTYDIMTSVYFGDIYVLTASGNAPVNSYFYNMDSGWNTEYGIQLEKAAFASGEAAYLLNGDQSTIVWKQTIGEMDYPMFTGETVYKVHNCLDEEVYSNTDEDIDHVFGDDHICDVCGYEEKPELEDSDDIKWQITSGTNADSPTTNLRLLTWVDVLEDYSAVTFNVTVNGKTTKLVCNTVYTAILASGVEIRNPDKVFNTPEARYFVTYTLKDIPNSAFNTPITVSVTWTDLQGNETTSDSETIIISYDWA